MRLLKTLSHFSLLLASAAAWSAADLRDLPLESLLQMQVEGASRFVQPLAEAPSSVTVLSADDMRRHGFRTVSEALEGVRGVYVSSERDYAYLGIRGFARPGDYNTRVLLMTDGNRRNEPLYDTAPLGREGPVEIDWVKRLEFAPGPSSALYGANAIFGVVNAVLWSGGDLNGNRVTAELGNAGMARVGWLSGQRIEDSEWLLGISAYGRRGENLYFSEFDAPGIGDGVARGRDGERTLKAIAKLSKGNWRVDLGFSSRHKNVPTAFFGTQFDVPGNRYVDQYGDARIGHVQDFSATTTGKLSLSAGAYRFDGQYVYPLSLNRDEGRADWVGFDYSLTYTGLPGHKLLAGIEARHARNIVQRNFDVDPRFDYLDDHRRSNGSGIYFQDEWRIGRQWLVNYGLRSDRAAGFSAVSPRVALIYHPDPAVAVKLMAGSAFRPPNIYERYYNDGNILQKTNPDLQPERITTHELAFDHTVSAALRISGSYYHYRLDRLIDQITDPDDGVLVFINRPTVHAHGVEIEAELSLAGGLRLKGSVARQKLHQPFGEPVNSPPLLGKLFVDGPVFGDWTLGAGIQAMSKRRSLVGEVPGHVVANLTLRRKSSGFGAWTVSVYNVADRSYPDPASAAIGSGAVVQDGRQVRLAWELAY